jgi:Tol biopolymer transport system component
MLEESRSGKTLFRRVEVDTGKGRTVFEGDGGVWSHAALAHDGRTLFYSLRHSNFEGAGSTVRLIRRDLETGHETELYRMESRAAGFFGVSLSPDGRRLAFMADVGQDRALVTMPEEGGEIREIYRAPSVQGDLEGLHWWGACWTADGRYILVTRSVVTEKQSDQLIAVPAEGGEPRVLAVMPGQIYNPAAPPDGRHIFFTSARRSHELWVMRNFLPQLQAAR